MFLFQELLAIQQQGPRAIGFFGTRNMGFMHQELIEILSYALVITVCSFISCRLCFFDTQSQKRILDIYPRFVFRFKTNIPRKDLPLKQ